MKFSWQLTNSFLNIHEQYFLQVLEKLTLSGIEIEDIESINNDKILNLSITTNRKEINSTFGLAREISSITGRELYIKPIKFHINKHKNNFIRIRYTRINLITKNIKTKTPKWLLETLKIYGEHDEYNLKNIQKYIMRKWGITFEILKLNKNNTSILNKKYRKLITEINNQLENYNDIQLIIFNTDHQVSSHKNFNYDISEFYENYYTDSMNLIKEIAQCTLGKYYELYQEIEHKHKRVILDKHTINKWLGSTSRKTTKFLQNQEVHQVLNKIKFFTQYIKNKKIFIVDIPKYREHDINNKIDIIEELGKIYEFKNFYNKYKYKQIEGKKSKNFKIINNIRNTLRNIGFNEVINCSIIEQTLNTTDSIELYNAINEEQTHLRDNISFNLIKNYIYHTKYSNDNLLIFEIGNTFKKNDKKNIYIEEQSLGGLIYAPEYNRINWSEQSHKIHLFHIKGIIEVFLKQIGSNLCLTNIETQKIQNSLELIIEQKNRISLYHKETKEIIGIIGKVGKKLQNFNHNKNNEVYIFEIELSKLIKTIYHKKHLDYNKKIYSRYPSITRDISLKVNTNKRIEDIKEIIQSLDKDFIESIKVFNEYSKIDTNSNQLIKLVGIRIRYRSLYETLNIENIKRIDQHLVNLVNKYK